MKRYGPTPILWAAWTLPLLFVAFGLGGALTAPSTVALYDVPNGRELGWVHDPEGLEVLERREGWSRVRLDGWIPDAPLAAVRGHAPAAPGTAVLLLRGSRNDGSWAAQEAAARAEVAPLEEEAQRLAKERGKALRMSNFSEATRRYDELDRQYKAQVAELAETRRRALAELTSSLASQSGLSTTLDGTGNFELRPPSAGDYVVFVPSPDAETFPCCLREITLASEDLWVDLAPAEGKGKRKKK